MDNKVLVFIFVKSRSLKATSSLALLAVAAEWHVMKTGKNQ
jgi:hypothetical protein